MPTEEVIREGKKVDEMLKQIDEDEDIAVLVLGASKEAAAGPLVSSLASAPMPASSRSPSPSCRASWPSRTSRPGEVASRIAAVNLSQSASRAIAIGHALRRIVLPERRTGDAW